MLVVALFIGCTENNSMFESANDFLSFKEGDVYTCKINSDVSFWYSPMDMYGEWTNGKTVIPIKMRSAMEGMPRVCSHYAVDFFDEYGCRFGTLVLCMSNNSLKIDTTSKKSISLKLERVELLNSDYQAFLDDQFIDLNWEGVVIKKVKMEVSSENSTFQPLEAWANANLDEVLVCEEGGFWFSLSSGKGYCKNTSATADVICCKITAFNPYPAIWYEDYDLLGGYYGEPCVKLYMFDECNSSILQTYEIFADEEGYYIWLGTEEEPVKAYLTKATEENDPRREFKAFFQAEDEQQNAYTFTCEQGNFSYSGSLGLGVWQTEAGQQNIKVSLGTYPLEISISTISNTEESKVLLKADFVEITDENTAKFKIRSEYLENEIFYAEDQPILYTEFSIVKHLDSTIK
jgi:hypothetical protein